MTSTKTASDSAREDLAFIKALVAPDDDWQQQFGKLYFAAGLCYSIQILLEGAQALGWITHAAAASLVIGWGPTVVFVSILIWVVRRGRGRAVGATSRAVGAVFGAVGLANVALCISIGSVSLRLHSQTIFFIYPVVVMILQGMAWLVAYSLRRRAWLGLVALGWFAVGVAMAVLINNLDGYVGAAAVGIICFMTLPGYHLMRLPWAPGVQGSRSA